MADASVAHQGRVAHEMAAENRSSGASASLVLIIGGRALFVLAQVLIARSIGAEGFGAFSLAWTVAGLGTLAGLFGIPHACIRYQVSGRPLWTQGYMPAGILGSLACALAIFVSADAIAIGAFAAPESAGAIRGLAFSIPMNVALAIWSASFKSAGWTAFGIFLTSLGLTLGPTVGLLLVWALGHGSPTAYAYAYTVGILPTVVIALARGARLPDSGAAAGAGARIGFALQSWMIHAFGVVNLWIDRFMVAAYSTLGELGRYQAASQLSMVPMLLAATITAVYEAPLAQARGVEARSAVFVRAQLYQIHLTLAGCVAGIVTAETWLGLLFGAEFAAGGLVLALLLFAQLVRAAAGPTITVLNLCGAPKIALGITLGSVIANLALNYALIPSMGALGAAIGAVGAAFLLVGTSLWACLALGLVRLRPGDLGGVLISLASMGLAYGLVRLGIGGRDLFEIIVSFAMVVAYFAPMAFSRAYSAEDELAGMLRRRLRRG